MKGSSVRSLKSANYNPLVNRMLYDSPLHTLWGKIIFIIIGLITLITLIISLYAWKIWLTPLENILILLYGILTAFVGSLIGLLFLRYLDRRNPESWWIFGGVLVVATLFTAAPAAYFNTLSPFHSITVGFSMKSYGRSYLF